MFTTDMENQERFTTAQHNRYKPRLDYMVEKYGEEFTIDDYGTVTSVKHPGWSIDVHYTQREERYVDNYIILLRRDEIQSIMEKILSRIYGRCKVFVFPKRCAPKDSTKNTTADALLRAGSQENTGCIDIYCCTSNSPKNRDGEFSRAVQAMVERGYRLHFQVIYVNKEMLDQITGQNVASYSADPKRFFCRASLTIPSRPDPDRMWQAGCLWEQFQK